MTKKRKLWKIEFEAKDRLAVRPESQSKIYSIYVPHMAANWLAGALDSPIMFIYVDERAGAGWQLHERINLREAL